MAGNRVELEELAPRAADAVARRVPIGQSWSSDSSALYLLRTGVTTSPMVYPRGMGLDAFFTGVKPPSVTAKHPLRTTALTSAATEPSSMARICGFFLVQFLAICPPSPHS